MNISKLSIFFLFLCVVVFSCRSGKDIKAGWTVFSKTEFRKLQQDELNFSRKLQAKSLYVPLFRVDYHKNFGRPIPLNSQVLDLKADTVFNLVPVIWLSDRVFLESDSSQLKELSGLIVDRVVQLTDSAKFGELVFDCDWTPASGEAYFDLIREVRGKLPFGLDKMTATLPLHYLRYADTVGKPPVDKVIMKMVGQSDLLDLNEKTDPIQSDLLRPYLMELETYGVDIEIGIPLGNWGILIRENKPIRMFFSINENEIKAQGEFSKVNDLIKVTENAYFQGEYLNRGDYIRLENYQNNSIRSLFHLVQEYTNRDSITLCLWNLEADFDQKYPTDLLRRWFEQDE